MRSHISRFLLCLSLIFFVGFGSDIKAFALTENNVDVYPVKWSSTPYFYSWNASGDYIQKDITTEYFSDRIYYKIGNANKSGVASFTLGGSGNFIVDINFAPDIYDYYFLCNVYCKNTYGCTFRPSEIEFHGVDSDDGEFHTSLDNLNVVDFVTEGRSGFSAWGKLNDDDFTNAALNYLNFWTDTPGTLPGNLLFEAVFIVLPKNQDDYTGVLTAIHSQLRDANLKLDEIADIIEETIEDQYSGDPENSFNVDDIVTQHNEKMGVLSFSSDVMMDILGLFSPDQTLSSELVFPSMSLTIAGQRNKVQLWPEYRFDLEELRQHWPTFINLMRTVTVASVWLLVLRYCYKVFEKYFLAGGSS